VEKLTLESSSGRESMLMVVLGAGASHDSSMDYGLSAEMVHDKDGRAFLPSGMRPPLANELFDLRGIFASAAEKIPKCQLILHQLRNPQSNMSVEQQLEKLREEAHNYPEGKRQLVAVQFYLQWVIGQCQAEWNKTIRSHTTYRALLGQINRQLKGKPVCMVTFNYDTLLEEAFASLDRGFQSLDEYVSRDDYKIIKPHGSVNWIRALTSTMQADSTDHVQMANRLIAIADSLEPSDNYYLIPEADRKAWVVSNSQIPGRSGVQVVLPAIAVPLEKKTGYSCPAMHVRALEDCVSKTDKLLVIGWKGAEEDFVKLLAQGLKKGIPKMLVSRSGQSAVNIRDKLIVAGLGTTGEWICAGKGFAEEIRSGGIESFVTPKEG